jgi:hypothetical protein
MSYTVPLTVQMPDVALALPPDPLAELLTIDIPRLSRVTGLAVRTLRRMDSSGDIPGRLTVGRRVLFQVETIRAWVRAGMPDRETWAALQRARSAQANGRSR